MQPGTTKGLDQAKKSTASHSWDQGLGPKFKIDLGKNQAANFKFGPSLWWSQPLACIIELLKTSKCNQLAGTTEASKCNHVAGANKGLGQAKKAKQLQATAGTKGWGQNLKSTFEKTKQQIVKFGPSLSWDGPGK